MVGLSSPAFAQQGGIGTTDADQTIPFFYMAPDKTIQSLMTLNLAQVQISGDLQLTGIVVHNDGQEEFTNLVTSNMGFILGPNTGMAKGLPSGRTPVSICQSNWTCINGINPWGGATTGWAQFGSAVGIGTAPNSNSALTVGGAVNARGLTVVNPNQPNSSTSLDIGGLNTIYDLEKTLNCAPGQALITTANAGAFQCASFPSGISGSSNSQASNNTTPGSLILPVGANQPTCTAGRLWFNTGLNQLEICINAAWQAIKT